MKLLVISAAFPPLRSGGADFVQRLCSELASQDIDVHALSSTLAQSADSHVTLHPIMSNWNWLSLKHCLDLVQSIKPDVIDLIFTGWMYHDHPMITFLPTLVKRAHPGVRVVVHIESLGGVKRNCSSLPTACARMLVSLIAGRSGIGYEYGTLFRDSDAIIILSDRDRTELAKIDATVMSKSVVIPPPPIMPVSGKIDAQDRISVRQSLGFSLNDFVISFYGYIYPGKGLETLLAATKHLIDAGHRIKLLIVGDIPDSYVLQREGRPDYLNELKQLASQLAISDQIVWTEYAPYGSDVPSRRLRASDACVLPFDTGINLHNSSFWFVAAHGIPIVTTNGKTTEPQFKSGENVLLCTAADKEALGDTILKLLAEPDLRSSLGERAEAMASESFSWRNCTTQTVKVYRNS